MTPSMACRRNLLQPAIILVLFIGVNGGLFGDSESSTSSQEDPATTQFMHMMKKQLRKDSYTRQSKRDQQLPGDLAAKNAVIRNFVFRKFKGEMLFMFSFLPEKKQCDILVSLSVSTQCNLTSVMHILSNESILRTSQQVKCFSRRPLRYPQCQTIDTMKILDGFWNQMGRLFNNISVAFQCNIINIITTTSLKYRQQRQQYNTKIKAPRITLKTAERQLELIFPYLHIKEKCSKVWKPLKKMVPFQSPASLLNLTVKLGARVKRKDWLRNIKKKAFQMYKIYYNYYYYHQPMRERPLHYKKRRPTNPPLLNSNDVRLNVIRVTKIKRTISVVFGMEVRRPRIQIYNRISPAKLLLVPLKQLGMKGLNSFFNGTVVKLTGAQLKRETDKERYVWSVPQIMESKRQFPRYLVTYYRQLDREGKCLVMLYISSHLQTKLRPVELLYNTFKYIPRKYFCSSTRRILVSPVANRTDTYIAKPKPKSAEKPSSLPKHIKPDTTNKNKILVRVNPKQTNTSKENDFPEDSEEQAEEEQEITPLEIGLFAILGFLCLAILAFTVNCVLFTIKKKKSAPTQQVNTAFARAVLTRDTNGTSADEHVEVMLDNTIKNAMTKNCIHKNGPSTNKSEQCRQNNPKEGKVTLSEEEICLHSNAHGLDLSLNRENETSDFLTDNKISDEVTVDISDNGNSDQSNCSQRTNSKCSVHDSRNSISLSITENSSALGTGSSQRTLKECSGELEVISDDNNDHVRSASCSSESDAGSKTSTKKLFVHLDQSSDKETAT
ncbi:uncharacterized protein LOC116289663 [Actinia tenebrosa]|uniref:Uncharacterized protein LOC116289663 n=1 Tax=Actinia tenebrosa TaxID=6105 RepID=A0A6P8H7R9_ACTTE|nr:uncharacterized protein LOC116289663 [Actinia tenebrosa]XP_031552471.1 uncharacterized protein LOC116289663 [Actinia tenebrosa]XP_031552472.1 uncharacterized protein LOC116289663 [Actinia tenebrosa]